MSLIKIKIFSIALFILMLNSVNAIDISITNGNISPSTIPSDGTYTLSFDINNLASATNPEEAVFLQISISGFDVSNNGGIFNHTAGGWTCSDNFTTLDCTKSFTIGEFPAGNSLPFFIDITTFSIVVNPDSFTINSTDESGLTEDNIADNSIVITSTGPVPPDLDFDNGVTLMNYEGVENQLAPIFVDFRINNLGGDAPFGASMNISHDELLFSLDSQASTIPTGWTCFLQTGGTSCNTSNPVLGASSTDFQLAFIYSGPPANYVFNGNLNEFSGTETNFTNNTISTNVSYVAALPDLDMNIVTPNTFPVNIPVGSTDPTPFTFRVSNIGNTTFQPGDVDVFVDHDLLFSVSAINTLATGWTCQQETVGTRCINTSVEVAPMDQIDISGEITGYPTGIMQYPSAVFAFVTDLTGAEAGAGLDLNNDFDITVNINPLETDLVLTKFAKDGAGAANLIAGDWPLGTNFYYHIHVDNLSSVPATIVSVTDPLPAGIQFVNDLSSGLWTCSADPFIDEFNSQGVNCTHPAIPANSPNFSEFIVIEVAPLNLGMKINTAVVGSLEIDLDPFNNDNIATPSVVNIVNPVINPDVDIVKSFLSGVTFGKLGANAPQGGQVVYKILVNNNDMNADNATNVVITDTLPLGVTFDSFNELGPNFLGNCSLQAVTTNRNMSGAVGGTDTVVCTAASLPFTVAEDGVEITVNVTGIAGTMVDNTATVSADNDATPGNNTSSSGPFEILGTIQQQVDLAILKDAQTLAGVAASSFDVNENFNYVLNVSNLGPDSASAANVKVLDNMPAGIEIVNITSAVDWDCSASNLANGTIDCLNTVAIDALTSKQIVIEVVGQTAGNFDNVADVVLDIAANATDLDPNNNSDNVLVDILAVNSELTFIKDVVGAVNNGGVFDVTVGESFQYKLTINNTSAAINYDDLIVTDTIDAGFLSVQGVSSDLAGFNCSAVGNDISCNQDGFTPLTPGAQAIITIDVLANNTGTNITNTATISSVVNIINNFPSNTVSVNVLPSSNNLTLVKSVTGGAPIRSSKNKLLGNTNFAIGDTVIYSLLLENTSSMNAISDLVVTDALDTNFLTFESFNVIQSSANFSCSDNGASLVTCTNSSGTPMNPGDKFEVEILATANAPGLNVSNIANASSVSTGENLNSNTILIDIDSGVFQTTLSVVKEAYVDGSPVNAVKKGTAFSYNVSLQNTGTEDAQNVTLVDTMPAGVVVNSATGTDWNCSNVNQQYTCNLATPLLVGASSIVEFNVMDNSADNINQLQNVVDVSADNAAMVSDVNNVDLTQVSLDLLVSTNPQAIIENSSFELIVDIVNTGSEDLLGVQFVNLLPEGFSYSQNRLGNGCTVNGLEMTCMAANPIAVGTIGTVIIPVNAISNVDTNATYSNVTTLTGSNFPSSVVTNTNFNVLQSGQLSYTISILDNIDPVVVGSPFMYDVTVENTGSEPISSLEFDVKIPPELTLTASTPSNASCTVSNSDLICQSSKGFNLLPGASLNVLNIEVNSPSFVGEVTTAVDALAEGVLNASASQVTTIISSTSGVADLSINKTASSNSVNSGEQFSWIIEVNNNGPDSAQNVSVSDQLPEGFELISSTLGKGGTCEANGSELLCHVGTMANNESKSITLLGTASLSSGKLQNLASVTSDTSDSNNKNNADSASITVNPVTADNADIYVEVLAVEAVVQGGLPLFEVFAGNNGPDSSFSPNINMVASGNLSNVIVESGADWNCLVKSLVMINCAFLGNEMINGHKSTLHVKLNPNVQTGPGQVLGLMATISSNTNDPNPANNSSSAEINAGGGNPTEQEILAAMQAALAGIGNQQTFRAIQNVASYCGNRYESALDGLCNSLYNAAVNGEGVLLNEIMEQITPNEVIGQSSSVSEIASAQFRNVGSRLSQLRGGGGSGFSTAGLNARYGNGAIPLGMLAYLDESPEDSNSVTNTDTDFISPWGFFVNGTISMGERDATGRELGFDFDTYGLTAGIDYRLDADKVIGVALGYANFDSKIGETASLKSSGLTLTGYGSFYVNDNFYVDSRISIAKPDFDQSRNIDFDIDDISVHTTAEGNTSANQYSFAMSAGYNFYKNAWNITPNAAINYVKTSIDGFTETGAGDFNFIYFDQEVESLVWSAGMKVSKAISLKNGVITPQFDFDYNYESMNDGTNIEARFIMAPDDEIFIIETDSPDRSYGSAGIGFAYVTSNGKQAYINYRSLFGLDGFSRGTFNLGARFEF